MSIELRLFQSFVVLWEEKNFARAAQRLNVSPPTLTHLIQKLEREVGVQLLVRKGNMEIKLTEAGTRFLENARDVLHQVSKAALNARMAARGEVGRVNLGYLISAGLTGLVPEILSEFQRERPGIEINLRMAVSTVLIDGITRHEFDVGLTTSPMLYPPGLEGHTVYEQPLVLAIPRGHRLARGRQPIDPASLKDELFVVATVESDRGFQRLTDTVARLGNFGPRVARRAPEMTSILTYVSAGCGVGVIPQSVSVMKMPNVVYRPIAGAERQQFPIVFVYRTAEASPATRALIDFMARYRV